MGILVIKLFGSNKIGTLARIKLSEKLLLLMDTEIEIDFLRCFGYGYVQFSVNVFFDRCVETCRHVVSALSVTKHAVSESVLSIIVVHSVRLVMRICFYQHFTFCFSL